MIYLLAFIAFLIVCILILQTKQIGVMKNILDQLKPKQEDETTSEVVFKITGQELYELLSRTPEVREDNISDSDKGI